MSLFPNNRHHNKDHFRNGAEVRSAANQHLKEMKQQERNLQVALCELLPHRVKVSTYHNGVGSEFFHMTLHTLDWHRKFPNSTIKPHLRSLDKLTQEIVVENYNEGKPFVPIEQFEIGDDDSYPYEFDSGNTKLIRDLTQISDYNVINDLKYMPSCVINLLKQWHFNVFLLDELQYIEIK